MMPTRSSELHRCWARVPYLRCHIGHRSRSLQAVLSQSVAAGDRTVVGLLQVMTTFLCDDNSCLCLGPPCNRRGHRGAHFRVNDSELRGSAFDGENILRKHGGPQGKRRPANIGDTVLPRHLESPPAPRLSHAAG
ncbi:hypothetical protein VTO73DRAFT_11388 [Trametes versicolor]